MPLNKSEAKQRLAAFCHVLKSHCEDEDFLIPELSSDSDQVLALLNCDTIKVTDLEEVLRGLDDYAQRPLEEQTDGSIVLFLVTSGSMGYKLMNHARLVAEKRQSEAETEANVEALDISVRDFSGPYCTKTLDEAVRILKGIKDLQKDGNTNKDFPQRCMVKLSELENQLWTKCVDMVVAHARKVLNDCIAEIVQASNNKGMVSYNVPGDEAGQTGGQQAKQVTVLINMEDVVAKLAFDEIVKHPLWPLAGSSKVAGNAGSALDSVVGHGNVVLGIAERALVKCNPDLGAVKFSSASPEQMKNFALSGMTALLDCGTDPLLHEQFKAAVINPFLEELHAASCIAFANLKALVAACLTGDTTAINKLQIKFVCSGVVDIPEAEAVPMILHVLNARGSDCAGQ